VLGREHPRGQEQRLTGARQPHPAGKRRQRDSHVVEGGALDVVEQVQMQV